MTLLQDAPPAAPAYLTKPEATTSAGREAVELARSAGLVLDPWQADALEVALAERPDGRWAANRVGLICPRQNGKGSILEARELAGLFLFGERLILHSAHEFKTAAEAFLRIKVLIQQTPDLDRRVRKMWESHGSEGLELMDGARLRFVARSKGSGRGFSGDTIILDEAYELSDKAVSAMVPTMSARPNPQLWFTSSAPLDQEGSGVLRRLCKRGRRGSPGLAYMEWCADQDAALDDRAAWAIANPGLGIRVSEEFIAETELGVMEPADFARERLGLWSEDDNSSRIIPAQAWSACEDTKSEPTGPLFYALDVSPDRAWASIAVAAESKSGGGHVELIDRRPGTGWLVARAAEVQQRWGGKVAIAKGSPAWSLKEDLEAAKVELLPISTEEHAQACGDLYDAVIERKLRHIDQAELNAAVAGADRRYYGDAWLWSRKASSVDISPLVAATLAHWSWGRYQPPPRKRVVAWV